MPDKNARAERGRTLEMLRSYLAQPLPADVLHEINGTAPKAVLEYRAERGQGMFTLEDIATMAGLRVDVLYRRFRETGVDLPPPLDGPVAATMALVYGGLFEPTRNASDCR
ncbi:hypothetical protein [Pseudaminobacter sp. NGMCC 1.201702]|uniref:hypothetical protein n=1 Tax=Pseudaminobacter sp. NGMCC 1.201702 TaxID=3391825 RepID=UPI0039EF7EF0